MKKFNFIILFLFLFLGGCAPKQETKELVFSDGKYTAAQLTTIILAKTGVLPILGDASYQFVDKNSIPSFYQSFKSELFNKGVTRWENSFDCNRFSLYFAAKAQIEYFSQSFHSFGRAEGVGIGEVYYIDDVLGFHAINIILCDGLLVFFEPQTGRFRNLSTTEIKNIRFIKF